MTNAARPAPPSAPTNPVQPQASPGNATTTATPEVYPSIQTVVQAFPSAEPANLRANLPHILKAMAEAKLVSRNQLIAIFATIFVETEEKAFSPIRESGGSKARYAPYFGRGYIQLTWKDNYEEAQDELNIPGLVANPDLALEPVNASRIFMWYWSGGTGRDVRPAAEAGNWRRVRERVNGGYRGWDKFIKAVNQATAVFTQGIDPAAVGAMPVDGAYGLGCADAGSGSNRTISGTHNPQSQGDALAYALGIHALDSQRSHEFRGTLNVSADPTILRLDAQKTFDLKGVAEDLDGSYTTDEVIFYPLAPGGIQAEVYAYKPDPKAPAPQVFLHDANKGISPESPPAPVSTEGDFANPCVGNDCISKMGWRPSTGSDHTGIDLAGPNFSIVASADGVVRDVVRGCRVGQSRCGGGYGNRVYVEHQINGKKRTTRYAHLASVESGIEVGQQVKRGQKLGVMGNTGHSLGNHLHYEIRDENGRPIDPFVSIKPQPKVSRRGGPAVPFRNR